MKLSGRSWFRIHLSTSIWLMFAVGLLMWANFGDGTRIRHSNGTSTILENAYGWPMEVRTYSIILDSGGDETALPNHSFGFWAVMVCGNLAVALVILFVLALSIEWIVRRWGSKPTP